jgi:hypothetical protein
MRFVELPTPSPSPLFNGGDTGISTARFIRELRAHSAHQLPDTMGRRMDRVESSYETKLSDQEI